MSTISVVIHSVANLPERVSLGRSPNPSVKLWLGSDVWESRRVENPGSFAQWEESAVFTWDNRSSLAIDLMSGSECFAKAFINLNEYIGRTNSWSGSIQLEAHGVARARPVLNCSINRGGSGPQPGFGVNVVDNVQVAPAPGFGGNQVFGQPGYAQAGFGGNQVFGQPGYNQPGFNNPMAR